MGKAAGAWGSQSTSTQYQYQLYFHPSIQLHGVTLLLETAKGFVTIVSVNVVKMLDRFKCFLFQHIRRAFRANNSPLVTWRLSLARAIRSISNQLHSIRIPSLWRTLQYTICWLQCTYCEEECYKANSLQRPTDSAVHWKYVTTRATGYWVRNGTSGNTDMFTSQPLTPALLCR